MQTPEIWKKFKIFEVSNARRRKTRVRDKRTLVVGGQVCGGKALPVVAVVIVVVPIMFGAPAVGVLVPPAMAVFPAIRARFREFLAPVLCLRAVVTVMLDRFVKLVVRVSGTLLAIVLSANRAGSDKHKSSTEHQWRHDRMKKFHVYPPVNLRACTSLFE
jgi:hypothetical protein